jgi:HEAT repeat protein
MDAVSAEMFEQIIAEHLHRRGCWIPSRFKKFPRFTIFTQKDELVDKEHLLSQFISLNPQVLALLAASDPEAADKLLQTVQEETQETKRSATQRLSPTKQEDEVPILKTLELASGRKSTHRQASQPSQTPAEDLHPSVRAALNQVSQG